MSKYFHFLNQILRLPTKWDVNKLKCNISKSRGVDCPNSTRKTSPNPHGNSPTVSPHIHNNFCPLSAPTLITFEYSISISSCVLGFWLVLNQVATPWSMEIRCSMALVPPKSFMPWSEYLIASWRLPPQWSSCHSGWLLTTHLHVRSGDKRLSGRLLFAEVLQTSEVSDKQLMPTTKKHCHLHGGERWLLCPKRCLH
jgi:hypothetical protein